MAMTIRPDSTRDLIAVAWYRIGYRPRESLVAVGLHGPRYRVGTVARVDLPIGSTPRPTIRSLAETMRRTGQQHAAVLLVSDRIDHRASSVPGSATGCRRGLVTEVEAELSAVGVGLLDVITVDATSFRSCRSVGADGLPAEVTPLSRVGDSEVAAAMVLAGVALVDDEGQLVADVEPSPREGAGAGRVTPMTDTFGPGERARVLTRWLSLLHSGRPDPDGWAGLTRALTDPLLREAIMISMVPGSGTDPDTLVRHIRTGTAPGLFAREPDADLAGNGRRVLAAVARQAPEGRRAPALSVLAWLSWWCGQGPRARLLAGRALRDVPDTRLAGLVRVLVERQVPPPWFDRSGGPTSGRNGSGG
jgi:hypothetical protein